MSITYLGYHFMVAPRVPGAEILVAELAEQPFESFVDTETGVIAYIRKEDWNPDVLNDISILENPEFTISHSIEEIEQVNWNEEWEKHFEPIDVDGVCYVRAPFHEPREVDYEIVIEPKMSFGTGHHETTFMMLQHLLDMDLVGKKTLDMGCGTAILAILAEMKGAAPIDAIDIDEWCRENSEENAQRNHCQHISVYQGDAAMLAGRHYDVVIANINRNILLMDMETYRNCLNPGGVLLLSGFYQEDIEAIDACCAALGLRLEKKRDRNNWAALKYVL